jgi:hypothetical protein
MFVRGLYLLAALAALTAIGVQFRSSVLLGGFSAVSFFSFFTIQANLLAAAVWAARALRPAARLARWRGAATLYLAATGLVYGVLLAGYQAELQTTIPWVDLVLHRVLPLAIVLDWLLQPPRPAPAWRDALPWLIHPALYLVYSLLRGAAVGWYPYPFLDPAQAGGYAAVAAYAAGIAMAIALLALLLVALARRSGAVGPAGEERA